MDIKLRARLSAYSKVDAIKATVDDIPAVKNTDIDALFPGQVETSITKGEIDTLFADSKKPTVVDKATIDTLFENIVEPEAVDKSDIDTLFNESQNVGRVSYADIDSLFGGGN